MTEDFQKEALLSDALLQHFMQTWRDRQVYWLAKDRARMQKGMLVLIVDSYDHAKMSLPKYPKGRTPKIALLENTRRHLDNILR